MKLHSIDAFADGCGDALVIFFVMLWAGCDLGSRAAHARKNREISYKSIMKETETLSEYFDLGNLQ